MVSTLACLVNVQLLIQLYNEMNIAYSTARVHTISKFAHFDITNYICTDYSIITMSDFWILENTYSVLLQ